MAIVPLASLEHGPRDKGADDRASAAQAGAWGAKLSGAGWGGHMIALVEPEAAPAVSDALLKAGATGCIITEVAPS